MVFGRNLLNTALFTLVFFYCDTTDDPEFLIFKLTRNKQTFISFFCKMKYWTKSSGERCEKQH